MAGWVPGSLLGGAQSGMERTGQQKRVRYSLSTKKYPWVLAYLAEDLINSDKFQNIEKNSDGMGNTD